MTLNVDTGNGPRCNIGPAEIRRRRWIAWFLTAATLGLAVALVAAGVSHPLRAVLWPVAAAAGVTWLQVLRRFCVRFGIAGLENFGALGEERRVAARQAVADQRRAMLLIGEGILLGLLATAALVSLPF